MPRPVTAHGGHHSRSHSGHRSRQHVHHQMITNMNYGASEISCCVKYSVFAFNAFFFIIGFGVLACGVWMHYEKNSGYFQLKRLIPLYLDPAVILIFLGTLVFVIGFSGCVGALRENTCFLALYSTIIGLLILGEIACGAFVYMSREGMAQEVYAKLQETIINYREDPDLQAVIDEIQMTFKCCGLRSPNDWERNIYFNKTSLQLGAPEGGGVPYSCCINPKKDETDLINTNCGYGARTGTVVSETVYPEGCINKIEDLVSQNFFYVCIVAFAVGVVQIFGVLFAQNLRSDIFAQRARWFRR